MMPTTSQSRSSSHSESNVFLHMNETSKSCKNSKWRCLQERESRNRGKDEGRGRVGGPPWGGVTKQRGSSLIVKEGPISSVCKVSAQALSSSSSLIVKEVVCGRGGK